MHAHTNRRGFTLNRSAATIQFPDNIFVDEHFENPDPALRRNAYLRQWKRGIPTDLDPANYDYATHLAPTNDATGFAYTD